ncbi:DNA-3-methyladenine glycosylase [Candidatus Izimaplasma bacterium HR1]|uniref:DNA-3-methyladenine glycosylase family protein n=1 Tax=Candidatus Izimoplasma sp. HR1 TaxID=1541959 RepID=UPI0004F6686F|nr:DNA-3-methyladenine glycosylase [Candidatus Izimaplasma bacterium HR1]
MIIINSYILNKPKEIAYLKNKSSEMKALIDLIEEVETFRFKDPFEALISQIVYQSISFKAANKIWERIYDNYAPFSPESVLSIPFDELREQGLTNSKTKYIRNIAVAFLNKEINTNFHELNDEEVMNEVQKIKGVGRWTAEMLLIFCLERPNVMSYGDLAIRKGLEWLYDIDHKITKDEFAFYKDLFSPYATTASMFLWEINIRAFSNKKDYFE